MKISLISLPFYELRGFPIGLSCISAVLKADGYAAEINDLNIELLKIFKAKFPNYNFDIWGERAWEDLGQALFSMLAFPSLRKDNPYWEYISSLYSINMDDDFLNLGWFDSFFDDWLEEKGVYAANIVGMSVGAAQLLSAIYISKKIKKRNPRAAVIIGGSYCHKELARRLLIQFSCFDAAVVGEGEATVLELVKTYKKQSFYKTKGTVQRLKNGTVLTNEARSPLNSQELDKLPYPDFSWLDFNYIRTLPIVGARGCPWGRCSFCNNYELWPQHAERSVSSIIDEIAYQSKKYNISHFGFHDFTFNSSLERAEEFCDEVIKLNKELRFWGFLRVDRITKKLIKKMKRAGFENFQIGLESLSDSLLRKMRKGVKAIDNIRCIKFCLEAGIEVAGNIISHFPSETLEEVNDLFRIVRSYPHLFNKETVISVYSFRLRPYSYIYNHSKGLNIKGVRAVPIPFLFPQSVREKLSYTEYFVREGYDGGLKDEIWSKIEYFIFKVNNLNSICHYYNLGHAVVIERGRRQGRLDVISLDSIRKDIFLNLDDPKTAEDLSLLLNTSRDKIGKILDEFVKKRIVFEDGKRYISVVPEYISGSGISQRVR